MGALVYRPPTGEPPASEIVTLRRLADQARGLLTDRIDYLPTLLTQAAGSAGGARPKFAVGLVGERFHLGHAPAEAEPWLIKLAAPGDPPDLPAVEEAYLHMAAAAGIDLPEHRLFRAGKALAFGMRRFDRTADRVGRLHALTFADLYDLGPTEQTLGRISYADLLRASRQLAGVSAARQMFRRMVFNVLAHNRDDHVRNHSFLADQRGVWTLSPAYDLTHAAGPGGYHSLDLGPNLDPERTATLRHSPNSPRSSNRPRSSPRSPRPSRRWPAFAEAAGVTIRRRDQIRRDHDRMLQHVDRETPSPESGSAF